LKKNHTATDEQPKADYFTNVRSHNEINEKVETQNKYVFTKVDLPNKICSVRLLFIERVGALIAATVECVVEVERKPIEQRVECATAGIEQTTLRLIWNFDIVTLVGLIGKNQCRSVGAQAKKVVNVQPIGIERVGVDTAIIEGEIRG